MTQDSSIKKWFGSNLADLLWHKIKAVYRDFDIGAYRENIAQNCEPLGYTGRIELHATMLRKFLPPSYPEALQILVSILGEENPNETGMFTHFYWIMPIGKFVEKYWENDFEISMDAIEEITKRNTGEYALRVYARRYPDKTLSRCKKWAKSNNYHLRRLASEWLRPKLPWSTKLDIWNHNPQPVFEILEILKEDTIKFVKKSVANHLRDWIKVNPNEAQKLIKEWSKSTNKDTLWILKHAQR